MESIESSLGRVDHSLVGNGATHAAGSPVMIYNLSSGVRVDLHSFEFGLIAGNFWFLKITVVRDIATALQESLLKCFGIN